MTILIIYYLKYLFSLFLISFCTHAKINKKITGKIGCEPQMMPINVENERNKSICTTNNIGFIDHYNHDESDNESSSSFSANFTSFAHQDSVIFGTNEFQETLRKSFIHLKRPSEHVAIQSEDDIQLQELFESLQTFHPIRGQIIKIENLVHPDILEQLFAIEDSPETLQFFENACRNASLNQDEFLDFEQFKKVILCVRYD